MSHSPFLEQRLCLLAEQSLELQTLASQPQPRMARECLALRQRALTQELVFLSTLAAQEGGPATAQTAREVAA